MRERTTWSKDNILKAASQRSKTAEDPTAMNQDHIQRQPPADKYLTGDPSTFAEDVHPSAKNWKAEYTDGTTTRDEIGLPEMRDDTFNHPEKDPGSTPARGGGGRQASLDEETLVKKADLCCKVARQILGPKAVDAAVEDQALALMAMSDSDLIATVNRMAQDQEQEQGQQEKQAQGKKDLPPEFLENIEKKKEEAKEASGKRAQDQEQGQGQQEQKQAQQGQMPDFIKEKIEEKEEKKEDKEASKKLGTLEQMAQQLQQMAQQVQQMMQQQGQQQQAPMQQEQQGQMQQEQQAQQQEQQALDQMLQQQSNDQMIDQMLQQQPMQMAANNELGVQIDSPSMDIGEVSMTPEDDVLTTLFANNTEVQNAQQAHTLQHGAPASLQVQASGGMTRTASTRTMGTKPTAGVSTIGGLGSPSPAPSGGDVEKLSALWNSAPDVSDVFRS
jgi:hypothetical protein